MKKLHEFSKAFLGCAIFSAVVIATGIAGFFVKGINWGLDFQPQVLTLLLPVLAKRKQSLLPLASIQQFLPLQMP